VLTNVTPSQAGSYSVVVFNAFGSISSSAAELTILSPPVILQLPQNIATNTGATVTFAVTAQGTGPLRYEWQRNLVSLQGATNRILTLTNVQLANAGNYTVIVRDQIGATVSSPVSLTVLASITILSQPLSQSAVAGDSATFEIGVSGTPPFGFRWRRNGATVIPFTLGKSYFTITNITSFDAGTYTVIVTNPVNTVGVISAPAVLAVLVDSDGDHLPDVWENANQLNPNVPGDDDADLDGDGFSNRQEYLAGTDPRDALSYLKFENFTIDSELPSLEYWAVSNKTYSVLWKPSLESGSWSVLMNSLAYPTNRMERVTDPTSPLETRFYRLVTPALRP
ncbi:MAG TPA: immunoglobulin domain-containing protein, partial [Verrucomicrobiae bacterium]|nr:immunoglobulin domain-containing protein [Verrucomicrobiae bacterium]